jgi:hypothetical protein
LSLPREAARLACIYFLERVRGIDTVEIIRIDSPEPRLLLGATFVSHVPTAARLVSQLDICSRIAREVPVFHVRSPFGGDAGLLAQRIAQHARSSG